MADDDYGYLAGLSLHPNRPGDTSKFNPGFAGNLAGALREANAQGLNLGVESGYRAPGELTSQGLKSSAARFDAAGNSLHSYGLAADISGLGGANSAKAQAWAAIAARHGLYNPYGIGNAAEFNHWQALPFTLDQRPDVRAALQQGGGVPTNYASATTAGPVANVGVTNPFMRALEQAESGGRNIYSTVDKDVAGPGTRSQGYFQINTPTWSQFAGPSKYPNAMSAPLDEQARVASLIPISRFGQRTRDLLHQQFGAFDEHATVGQLAANYGTTLTSTPSGQGGIGSDYVAGLKQPTAAPGSVFGPPGMAASGQPAGSVLPGFSSAQASNSFKQGAQALGDAFGLGGGEAPQAPRLPGAPQPMALNVGNPRMGAMALGAGRSIANPTAAAMQGMSQPMQWGAAPPGQSPFAGIGQAPGQNAQAALMQLNMMNSPYYASYGTSLGDPSLAFMGAGGFGGYS